jgi:crossover junction endodeoxyribonuclease RuvC
MRVLGVDPGSQATGYGVVDRIGQRLRLVADGTIRQRAGLSMSLRLKEIFNSLNETIRETEPDQVAVETVFFARNPQSALKLGQTRGVVLLSAAVAGLPVFEYSPLEIKKSVVGYGQATKEQVQRMVATLVGNHDRRSKDAADALAVSICHLLNAVPLRDGRLVGWRP